METVLVVGSTGNIGTSAVIAALRSGRNVLAVVRNQNSADKLIKNVGTAHGITFAHADVTAKTGIKEVVRQVRAGRLPAFQHVWSSVGGAYAETPLQEITDEQLEYNMNLGFTANFRAYRDTIGCLLEQNNPKCTWTTCTGTQGELAVRPLPAMNQGSMFSMCIGAARENAETTVRFNEILLGFRVEVDAEAKVHGFTPASEFGRAYEFVLANQDVRSSRIRVDEVADMEKLIPKRLF